MSKRRVDDDSDIDVSSSESEDEQQEQQETVDVDFDYFDLNPEVDFHATKNFLRQLLGDDSSLFDLSGIADMFLKEHSVGTTIKTEGKDGDPFALLSVINVQQNKTQASLKTLLDYLVKKTSGNLELNMMLKKLLADNLKLGLIISERLINMPVEVVPPMYKMLLEEMTKASDAHESYEFDYFLIISKVYKLVAANVEDEDQQKSKKKKPAASETPEMDYFHYEDMVLEANAMYHDYYDYNTVRQETDSRRVFTEYGIDPKLSLILIHKDNLAQSIPEMEQKFPPF